VPIQPTGAGHVVALQGGAVAPRGVPEAAVALLAGQVQAQRFRRRQEVAADEAESTVKKADSEEEKTPQRRVEASRRGRQDSGRVNYLA
jgi:hypothetical protein